MSFEKHGLSFTHDAAPEPGTHIEVAPGLNWVRMPLPFRLNHVNIWLLPGDAGWTAIDTGCDTPEIRALRESCFAGVLAGSPITQLIATHGHVDHIGLVGWITNRFGCTYHTSFAEWIWSRLGHLRDVPEADAAIRSFMHRHGVPGETTNAIASGRAGFMDLAVDIPGTISELRDGAMIRFGNRGWRIILTRGHTYEHASFYCAEDRLLIAGDHLLPRISPVIAVYEMIPDANPLGDYLASFEQFADIPDDVLVLPSHGMPYRGLHRRIAQLEAHHEERLTETEVLLATPLSAFNLSRKLFAHVKETNDTAFALGETVAHVNHLLATGRVRQLRDAENRSCYQSIQRN